MSRRNPRSILKAFISLAFLVIVLGACSSDGFPVSYDDQIDPETGLSNVEANWLDGCTVGLAQSDLAEAANSVCECAYEDIKAQVPFEEFVQINNDLDSDPSKLGEGATLTAGETRLTEIVRDCIARG